MIELLFLISTGNPTRLSYSHFWLYDDLLVTYWLNSSGFQWFAFRTSFWRRGSILRRLLFFLTKKNMTLMFAWRHANILLAVLDFTRECNVVGNCTALPNKLTIIGNVTRKKNLTPNLKAEKRGKGIKALAHSLTSNPSWYCTCPQQQSVFYQPK